MPKPPGSGRQPGTPNRVGKEARELAGKYTSKAFKRLAEILDSKDEKAAAIAAREILDRAFGKPVSPSEIAGPGGTPLIPSPEIDDFALASLITFITAKSGQIERPALKPIVGAVKQADPFADQRADQQRQIAQAHARTEPRPTVSEWLGTETPWRNPEAQSASGSRPIVKTRRAE